MSYPLDKRNQRKKIQKIFLGIFFVLVFLYFSGFIFNSFSGVAGTSFRPFLILGRQSSEGAEDLGNVFRSKDSLIKENEELRNQLDSLSSKLTNYNSILDENIKLREIIGRKRNDSSLVLAGVLSKPNKSPYDTLIIDVGEREGISTGQIVLASGSIPIGRISEVYAYSSKVVLFSSPGERNEVAVSGKDIFLEALGRGGGNFELVLSREIVLDPGTEILLPGIDSRVVGVVRDTISDPRDAYNKVLFVSPINIQEIRFVQVEIN